MIIYIFGGSCMGAFLIDFIVDFLSTIVDFIFKKEINRIRCRKKDKRN